MKYAVSARVGVLHATIASALSGAFSFQAVAQEDEDGVVETVIVTARFREESIQQTPIAITAVTNADIEVRGITEAYEIANLVPNASLRPAQAAFGNTMTAFIRGIGQNDFDFAFEPGVGIYIDDVYHPFTLGSQMDLLDLERVEVLRGPQGTLFGRGSIGGAMRYITAKPQGDNTGTVQVTAGDYNRVDVRASYDFAAAENLFVRVAGVSRSREGYQDVIDFACAYPSLAGTTLVPQTVNRGTGCKVGTQGGEDVTGIRSTMRWAPSESFEISVSADYLDDDSEAKADTLTLINPDPNAWPSFIDIPYDSRFLPPNPYVSYATYDDPVSGVKVTPQSGMEKSVLSARADWYFGNDINLAVIAAYTDLTATLSTDGDVSPINVQVVDGLQDIDYMTTEVRLSGLAFDSLEWTVGAFYYDGESINNQMVSIPLLSLVLDGVPPTDNADQPFVNARNVHQNRNESIFGHVVYDFSDRFSVNAGVRYSDDSKIVNFDNTRVQNPRVEIADDRTDWRIGFDYQVSDNLMAYISAATGYRPGSYNPRPFQATQVVAVEAEDSEAYEIGFKSDLADRKLRLNAALFYTDWKTRILPVGGTECLLLDLGPPPVYLLDPPGTPGSSEDSLGNNCVVQVPRTFYENGPGKIQGLEVELLYYPTSRISLSAIYGMTDWSSEDITDDPTVISDFPAYVPEDNWAAGMAYEAMLPGGSTFTPRVDVYGQSEICTGVVSTTDAFPGASCSDGYELVSVRFEWASADDDWRVALGATNVTDEQYYLNQFDLTGFGYPNVEGQPGAPKEWYLSFQRNF